MKKFEYKTLRSPSDAGLREAGLEGWELVAVTFNPYMARHDFFFKREIAL
jgi:hypothetical protein